MVSMATALGDRPVPGGPPATISRRQVAAAVIGNVLEFYDFTTYAFFAVQIGGAFFPGHTPFIRLMLSLATFGAGFASRPLGAVVIGAYGDRAGRRPAMVLSFALMGLALLALALTPDYAVIGPAAVVIVVLARLVQGFALGGEVGPTTAFLLEAAPPARRGFYGGWQIGSQGLSILAAGLVGVGLSSLTDAAGLQNWGWRVAFLIGAAVLPFGLLIRLRLPETLHAPEAAPTVVAARGAGARTHARTIVLGLACIMSLTTLTYVMTYMTTYAVTSLGMPPGVALASQVTIGAGIFVFNLLGGALSDRFGRKPMMIWPRLALLAAIYPAFLLIVEFRSALVLLSVCGALAALGGLSSTPSLVWLTESLPKGMRSAAVAVTYATAVAVFGGTTQPIIAWLIHLTGDVMAPAWYLMAMTAVGVLVMTQMEETVV